MLSRIVNETKSKESTLEPVVEKSTEESVIEKSVEEPVNKKSLNDEICFGTYYFYKNRDYLIHKRDDIKDLRIDEKDVIFEGITGKLTKEYGEIHIIKLQDATVNLLKLIDNNNFSRLKITFKDGCIFEPNKAVITNILNLLKDQTQRLNITSSSGGDPMLPEDFSINSFKDWSPLQMKCYCLSLGLSNIFESLEKASSENKVNLLKSLYKCTKVEKYSSIEELQNMPMDKIEEEIQKITDTGDTFKQYNTSYNSPIVAFNLTGFYCIITPTGRLCYKGNLKDGLYHGPGSYYELEYSQHGMWFNGHIVKGTYQRKSIQRDYILHFTGKFNNNNDLLNDNEGMLEIPKFNTILKGEFDMDKFAKGTFEIKDADITVNGVLGMMNKRVEDKYTTIELPNAAIKILVEYHYLCLAVVEIKSIIFNDGCGVKDFNSNKFHDYHLNVHVHSSTNNLIIQYLPGNYFVTPTIGNFTIKDVEKWDVFQFQCYLLANLPTKPRSHNKKTFISNLAEMAKKKKIVDLEKEDYIKMGMNEEACEDVERIMSELVGKFK